MRVAIYARSLEQSSITIKQQIKKCEVFAKRKNINVQGIFIDHDFSYTGDLPRFQKLMSKLSKYDCIVVSNADILPDYYKIKEELNFKNIELFILE